MLYSLIACALAAPRLSAQESPKLTDSLRMAAPGSAERIALAEYILAERSLAARLKVDSTAGTEVARASEQFSAGYRTVARDPARLSDVLVWLAGDDFTARRFAKSAAQVSQAADETALRLSILNSAQQARIVEQNDRIIQLLEQLLKK